MDTATGNLSADTLWQDFVNSGPLHSDAGAVALGGSEYDDARRTLRAAPASLTRSGPELVESAKDRETAEAVA